MRKEVENRLSSESSLESVRPGHLADSGVESRRESEMEYKIVDIPKKWVDIIRALPDNKAILILNVEAPSARSILAKNASRLHIKIHCHKDGNNLYVWKDGSGVSLKPDKVEGK